MSKQRFRSHVPTTPSQPSYPTLEDFDGSRRDFLARLGGALLGASALAGVLSGCDGRSVSYKDQEPDGGAPGADSGVDGSPPEPDGWLEPAGVAPEPDARIDREPDLDVTGGVPRQPDATIDSAMDSTMDSTMDSMSQHDLALGGVPRAPDAKVDEPDLQMNTGYAPLLDAAIDDDKPGGWPGR